MVLRSGNHKREARRRPEQTGRGKRRPNPPLPWACEDQRLHRNRPNKGLACGSALCRFSTTSQVFGHEESWVAPHPNPSPQGEGRASLSSRTQTRRILTRMHPALRPYYDHVFPVFWPWLWLNLVRFALWHLRTGHDALLAVDCFGNIRIVYQADEPALDDLYTYEAPLVPRWERPALSSDLPVTFPTVGDGAFIASLCRVYVVFYVVRERVRGPPRDHPPLRSGGGGSRRSRLTEGALAATPVSPHRLALLGTSPASGGG
jgi:hypothetical protein